jgi:hypothetical protein
MSSRYRKTLADTFETTSSMSSRPNGLGETKPEIMPTIDRIDHRLDVGVK